MSRLLAWVRWRVDLSNNKPEVSQGERAQWWDTVCAWLVFVYCYTYEAYGMIWTLCYTALYPYILHSIITKAVPFLDEMFGDERVSKLCAWYGERWKEEPGGTLVISGLVFSVWYWAESVWVRGAVGVFACMPLFNVLTTRGAIESPVFGCFRFRQ